MYYLTHYQKSRFLEDKVAELMEKILAKYGQ